jgi:hypothetical protein
MRTQSLTGLLAYEARRRPEIKLLVDKVAQLTDDDIERAVVPLPWFKQALRQMRAEERTKTLVVTSTNGFVANPPGVVKYWSGPASFIPVSYRSSIEVKTDYPLWFPDDGGVWIDTVYCSVIPSAFEHLPNAEAMTKLEYMSLLRERLNNRKF